MMTALSVYLTCSHVGGWATYSLNALMQQTYLNVLATRLLTQKLYQFCLSHQFEISCFPPHCQYLIVSIS